MSYGQDLRMGISLQNSFGTSNIDSMHWLEVVEEGLSPKKEPIIRQGLRGVFDEGQRQEGMTSTDGDVVIEANPIALGVLLSAMYDRTTSLVESVYQHVFEPRQTDYDKFSGARPFTALVDIADGGSAHQYSDCVGASIEFGVNNGELLTAKLTTLGGKYAQVNASALSGYAAPTGDAIDWSVASINFGADVVENLRNLTVTIDEAMENKWMIGIGGRSPGRTKRSGSRTVTIAGTLMFDDQDQYQKFLSQVEEQAVLTFLDETEIASGYTNLLEFDIPLLRFDEFPIPVSGPGEVEVSFSAAGVYSVNSDTAIQITLINTQAAY